MTSTSVTIAVREPFDLRLTVGALRRLPSSALYRMSGEEFRLLVPLASGHRLLAVTYLAPELTLRALDGSLSETELGEARSLLGWMLGVERDLAPVQQALRDDPVLGPLVGRLVGLKPPRFASLWEAFCQIVPFQQVSLSSAISSLNRLSQAFGPQVDIDGERYVGVPTPQALLSAEISAVRACGLSAAKAQTLRSIAQRAAAGDLDRAAFDDVGDDEAIARLTTIPGIGPWSAQVALLRGLGRLTVFPSGDAGAIRSLRELYVDYEQPTEEARAALDRLGQWRGYLYFLLLGRRLLKLEELPRS